MSITLDMDEQALACLPLGPGERERLMQSELSCRFYANGWLSLGQAARMAKLDRYAMGVAFVPLTVADRVCEVLAEVNSSVFGVAVNAGVPGSGDKPCQSRRWGSFSGMTAVLTEDGQLPLPRELCEQLGLAPGQALEICSERGRLVAWKKSTGDAFEKWRGRGHLPTGANADEYLRLIRDGDSR
jgi:bifunctional DNA-binding transcriptional regulator/antitoxin component of YhaV-PrlF toxin-antitoxin module